MRRPILQRSRSSPPSPHGLRTPHRIAARIREYLSALSQACRGYGPASLIFEIFGAAIPELFVIVRSIPQSRRASPNHRSTGAVGADAVTSLAHRQRSRVGEAEVRMMTGRTRDVVRARKNRIKEKQLPKLDPLVVGRGCQRIVGAQDHLRELADEPTSALADSGRVTVA